MSSDPFNPVPLIVGTGGGTITKQPAGGGSLQIGNVVIPIKTYKPKFGNNTAENTDSSNFDATTKRVYRDRSVGVYDLEVPIEFNFILEVTQTSILDVIESGGDVIATGTAGQDAMGVDVPLFYGTFLLSEGEISVDVAAATTVTGTATLQSRGKFKKSAI